MNEQLLEEANFACKILDQQVERFWDGKNILELEPRKIQIHI